MLDIDPDLIEHAVTVRLRGITAEEFFAKHADKFLKVREPVALAPPTECYSSLDSDK